MYMSEGIQIAQRGAIVVRDPVVSSVPTFARDLFFPSYQRQDYYSIRFMGFFIKNPDTGAVVGQFPHLFPASIAIGYGLDGLTGARRAVGVWAILGVLAVYFAGRRLVGTPAAWAAATLLALHVVQVWFARYPNAEMAMQALLFAAILAHARAHVDGDGSSRRSPVRCSGCCSSCASTRCSGSRPCWRRWRLPCWPVGRACASPSSRRSRLPRRLPCPT